MLIRLLFILFFCGTIPLLSAAEPSYWQSLLQKAQTQQLAKHRVWHILLHYQPNNNGWLSEVDDPKFFLAPTGKTQPKAELMATLKAFFTPPVKPASQTQHPQCAFIARYHWLNEQLAFDPKRLPPQPCPEFESWLKRLQPAGLTLIFPTARLNNPSSMFGHTLLRIDQVDQTEDTRILAYALNYAAQSDEKNGLVFAFKGITGGYHGLFSMLPYYKKVKEYGDMENRDIWEYQLDFNLTEIHRLLRHVWELDKIYFDYYFFDENCAYHLFSLLEAARPSLHIRDKLLPWVIPGETVRVIAEKTGLVKKTIFRPASTTQLRHHLNNLTAEQQNFVQLMVTGEMSLDDKRLSRLDITSHTNTLEVAYDYLYYQRQKMPTSDRSQTPLLRQLLMARSKIPTKTALLPPPSPAPHEQGHPTFRLSIGFGTDNEQAYQSLQLRPAYHDLLDSKVGYTDGAQINFLDLSLRHPTGTQSVKLESLKLIDIISLSPQDRFFKAWSWKFNTGLQRRYLAHDNRSLIYRTHGGAGMSYKLTKNSLSYVFAEADLDIGGELQQDYALGLGGRFGILTDIIPGWRMLVEGSTLRFGLGHQQTLQTLSVTQRLSLNRNNALLLQLQWHDFDSDDAISQIAFNWRWYF